MHTLLKLNNGLSIPQVGLGVYRSEPGAETRDAVISALKLGYRHIDTAQFYQNEADVGQAIRSSGVPQQDVWVTSKVFPQIWSNPATAYDQTLAAVQQSVKKVGFGSIDLILLHAPGSAEGRPHAWRALEQAVKQGWVRSIGVSNFGVPHLKKLSQTALIPPAINQIELHPWLQWRDVVKYCQENGVIVEAYSPLAKASKLSDPKLTALAQTLGKTPAQVLLRWSVQKGYVPLPKSVSPERQASNADIFTWQLDDAAMQQLDSLEADLVTGWDPIRNDPV
eukprot:gene11971-12114_t